MGKYLKRILSKKYNKTYCGGEVSMVNYSLNDLERIKKECKRMVIRRAAASGGAAIVPLPGTDFLADVSMLIQLLPAINHKFGLSEEQLSGLDSRTKAYIYGYITAIGSRTIGKMISREIVLRLLRKAGIRVATKQVVKYVPLVGQGMAAALSFSAMRHAGYSHINDCYKVAQKIIEQQNEDWKLKGQPVVIPLEASNERRFVWKK
jgi:uncharacterized protein (DUF697 family)